MLWLTARLTFTPCASAGASFCFLRPVRLALSGWAVGTGAGAGVGLGGVVVVVVVGGVGLAALLTVIVIVVEAMLLTPRSSADGQGDGVDPGEV